MPYQKKLSEEYEASLREHYIEMGEKVERDVFNMIRYFSYHSAQK